MATPWGWIQDVWQERLRAERMAGQAEAIRVVAARMADLREEIRQDWTQDAVNLPSDARAEIDARHIGKAEVYNEILDVLHQNMPDDSPYVLPEIIHPEAMSQRVSAAVEQEMTRQELALAVHRDVHLAAWDPYDQAHQQLTPEELYDKFQSYKAQLAVIREVDPSFQPELSDAQIERIEQAYEDQVAGFYEDFGDSEQPLSEDEIVAVDRLESHFYHQYASSLDGLEDGGDDAIDAMARGDAQRDVNAYKAANPGLDAVQLLAKFESEARNAQPKESASVSLVGLLRERSEDLSEGVSL